VTLDVSATPARPDGPGPGTPAALEGVKVADFTWAAAGPIATKTLADHGATVVRVESRAHPDSVRLGSPFAGGTPGINRSGFFADFNSSKYDLALNLKRPEAYEVAKRLILWADVVVESFTPRVMAGWRLSYQDIVHFKPDVIMLSSCMQGQTGPFADYPGFGSQGAALAGFHYLTGWTDRIPAGPKGAYTDGIAPRYSVAAILAALDYRDRTGLGQHIDLAQVEAGIQFLGAELLDYTANGRIAERRANRSGNTAPHGSFPCQGEDRWITIVVETDDQWTALCRVMGDPAWAADARFRTLLGRLAHEDELETRIAEWTSGKEAFAAVEALQAAGVPAGVVQKASDLFDDPQLAHRQHFRPLDHAEMGTVAYNGPAHELSETPAVLRWAAPLLGEHTEYVLKELLGYSDAEVEALAAQDLLQ